MTKEEKIKETWGDNYNKDVIMKGRRCGFKIITNIEYISTYQGGDWYCEPDTFETIAFMPTTLRKILKNNGWIKIESEEDLPKEDGSLHIFPPYKDSYIFFFHNDEPSREELVKNHTHYQPIEKPKPPIY